MALGLLIPQFTPEIDLGSYATQTWVYSQLSGYSKTGHSHSEYASSSHTHTYSQVGAAASNHTHSNYASSSHSHTCSEVGAAASTHYHSASDITSGTLSAARGGTGYTSLTSLKSALGISDSGGGIVAVDVVTVSIYKTGSTKTVTLSATAASIVILLVGTNAGADKHGMALIKAGSNTTITYQTNWSMKVTFNSNGKNITFDPTVSTSTNQQDGHVYIFGLS